ncbi:MAG: TonB-dependent receptor plug domain-containing protein [Gemmatimonadaceae bacterium]
MSLHTRDLSLREALDRVATASAVRLSYTSDLIPVDTRMCASFDSVPLGDALRVLLRGIAVIPVAAGGDHVALTPAETDRIGQAGRNPRMLDRVVVTGSTTEGPARRLTVAMNVVSGAQLARYSEGNLARALSDLVPGLWIWQSPPTSLVAHYASIRGTSSLGSSYPKIYVDGIELANPLLVIQLTPETVERIEVIRGPQGAALYGTDAISGVINIVTRHDGSDGGPTTVARSAVGTASSAYMSRPALTQDHAVSARTGSSAQSATASFASGGVGEYLPGAFARHTAGSAGFRVVRSRLITAGTGRFFASESADPASPLFRDSVSAARAGTVVPQSVRELTIGGSTTFTQSERWTHTITTGLDRSTLSNLADYSTPLPSAVGTHFGSVRGDASLASLRMSSAAKLGDPDNIETTLTFAAENSLLNLRSADVMADETGGESARVSTLRRWTTAGLAQTNVAWRDAGFLTAGLRVERNDALGSTVRLSALPMLGVATLRDFHALTLKLRSAYGRGIRPASTLIRQAVWFDPRGKSRVVDLSSEQQSGIETGVDVYVGRAFGLQLTRFDQLASGVIQRVAYVTPEAYSGPSLGGNQDSRQSGAHRHIAYVVQNVGEISNRGWELKSDLNVSSLTLTGTLSTVDSRVRRVLGNYVGDLRAGDRMLDVPSKTGSISAAWTGKAWTTSLNASRSWDWIGYDRIALAGAFSNSTQSDAELVGQELRKYWLKYSGVTRLRASVGRTIFGGLSFSLSGENLLDYQRGEPDNITVVPGRTLTVGLRAVM